MYYNYGKAKNLIDTRPDFAETIKKADCVECYKYLDAGHSAYHTDNLGTAMDWEDLCKTDRVILHWALMGKDDYSSSVLANSCLRWDDMHNDGDRVLVILYE